METSPNTKVKQSFYEQHKVHIYSGVVLVIVLFVLFTETGKKLWSNVFSSKPQSVYTGKFTPDPQLRQGAQQMLANMRRMGRQV